ncbi:MAG TPA: polysaccharide biosynthesis tyrosine autokinase [Vicinamibacterales bacterium]|nr:polysaccharide biosynthesis tyrosine autokinase [Vicinamibacterales bacterium]
MTANANANQHLYDRLAVVVKYWKAVAVVFVLAASVVLFRAYSEIPEYDAKAQLYVDEELASETNMNNPLFAYVDPEVYLATQLRILNSRDLALRAVQRLHLENVPEYNGQGAKPTRIAAIRRAIGAALGRHPAAPASAPAATASADPEKYVDAFLGHIRPELVKGTRLMDVHYKGTDPEFAAKAVNVLVQEYVAQNLENKTNKVRGELTFITSQVTEAQQRVTERQHDLTQYTESHNAISLDNRQDIVTQSLSSANDEYNKARLALINAETAYNAVNSAPDPATVTTVASQASVLSALKTVNDLTAEKARLSQKYGPNYSAVVQNKAQLDAAEKALKAEVQKAKDSIRLELDQARDREHQLRAELSNAKSEAQDLNRKGVDYAELQRQLKSDTDNYAQLLQRKNDLEVAANSKQNNVRISDLARAPSGPVNRDTSRAWMIAIVIGLAAGMASAFALDYLDDTVKTPDDVRWRLKVHFLGLVPKVRDNDRPLLSDSVPPAFGEAFRALRTALVIRTGNSDTRIVAMTSAQPLEGKTTTAVNTALALAIGGARVLLIDADMRRPSVHKALRMANQKGLSELLQAQAKIREVVRTTVHPNLLAVSAGAPPSNPSELLASDRMRALIDQLEHGPFDWVIIDTPPVLAVTDAVILAPLVSAVTFVVGAEMTRWRLAERAIETLQSGSPRSISAVLNRVDFDRNRYYYARYYGQHYYSYYAEDVAAAS